MPHLQSLCNESLYIGAPRTVSNWASPNLLKVHYITTPLVWNFGSAAWFVIEMLQNQQQNINISCHKLSASEPKSQRSTRRSRRPNYDGDHMHVCCIIPRYMPTPSRVFRRIAFRRYSRASRGGSAKLVRSPWTHFLTVTYLIFHLHFKHFKIFSRLFGKRRHWDHHQDTGIG